MKMSDKVMQLNQDLLKLKFIYCSVDLTMKHQISTSLTLVCYWYAVAAFECESI